MTNPRIKAILREIFEEGQQDKKNEKLILIDDITRIKRMMFGMGFNEHNEFLSADSAGQLFDVLYDMNIQQLELVYSGYEKQVNENISLKLYENLQKAN